jgi:ribulose-5-phosphate 4-epimerase/fuculose-1-phosphate aldolase
VIQDSEKVDEQTLESTPPIVETSAPVEEVPEESTESVDEDISEPEVIPAVEADQPVQSAPEPVTETVVEASPQESVEHQNDDQQAQAELEIARLNAEVERLRMSMAGAVDVIEELETPPMPPAVIEDIIIGAHIVSDFARLARQLDREQLIRATMGTIAMLHPDNLGIMVSTRNRVLLPRLDERGLCAGFLGKAAPRGAPADWRTLEVILALASSAVTGGPAAVIHSHGPYTTAASCEKDLVLVQPIDKIGKEQIGNVIIVDPDEDDPAHFLKQITEALYQGGMRCVVVRGMGAYAVGANLDQAWANAAMLEHSMRIVLLARQANLKI